MYQRQYLLEVNMKVTLEQLFISISGHLVSPLNLDTSKILLFLLKKHHVISM